MMAKAKKIQIVKHEKAVPLNSNGDILKPFKNWNTTTTADGWYSKFSEKIYKEMDYLPLSAVHPNSWGALTRLGINCFDFKEEVQYECPYNGYTHFWCVPVFVFSNDVKYWIDKWEEWIVIGLTLSIASNVMFAYLIEISHKVVQ